MMYFIVCYITVSLILIRTPASAENQAIASLSRSYDSATLEDSISYGTIMTWTDDWHLIVINETDNGEALANPSITFQSDRSFSSVYPDDPEIYSHDPATGAYVWNFGAAGVTVSEPEHLVVSLSEGQVEVPVPFSADSAVSPLGINEDTVIQTITVNFTLHEPLPADTNNFRMGLGDHKTVYGEDYLLERTVVSQNEVPGWTSYTDGYSAQWYLDDPLGIEIGKTYTFIAQIRMEKKTGFSGNITFMHRILIGYWHRTSFDSVYNETVSLSHPEGPAATFRVDNMDVTWNPSVSSSWFDFSFDTRFEYDGILVSGVVTDAGGMPVKGAVMEGLPSSPVTDENGYYAEVVERGWSGTVAPVLAGYAFEPESMWYVYVTDDQFNRNYTIVQLDDAIPPGGNFFVGNISNGKLSGMMQYQADFPQYDSPVDIWALVFGPGKINETFGPAHFVTRNGLVPDDGLTYPKFADNESGPIAQTIGDAFDPCTVDYAGENGDMTRWVAYYLIVKHDTVSHLKTNADQILSAITNTPLMYFWFDAECGK